MVKLPRRFGRYTLLKQLRKGAMGEAFLAASGEGDSAGLCVVKLGLPDLSPDLAARFADEAKVMRRLSFSNIARVFETGDVDGVRFIAMEYIDGWNLDEVSTFAQAAHLRFPLPVAAFIAKEIAHGLHYAHTFPELQVIHRDVAPANVMLDASGEVKLIDFGLARSTVRKNVTVPGTVLGHVGYFAPERFTGTYDHRSDLYSAGVILWELLAGEPLLASRNTEDQRVQALPEKGSSPSPPSSRRPEVDAGLDQIVLKAVSPAADARFQDGEAMRAALGEYLGRTAPTTDCGAVAAFLREAIGEEIMRGQRAERERLLGSARENAAPSAPVPALPRAGDPERDPRLGTVIEGKYRIEGLCGMGGIGRVYAATHVGIQRKVAVKILKDEYRDRPDLVERFEREARLASRSGSPNIVQITDLGVTQDGCPYLAMEYLDGETLQQRLGRGKPLPFDLALRIAIEVARGLESAHGSGVVHRDLKPSNVMLLRADRPDAVPRVKIVDFGISKSLLPPRAGAPVERALTRPLTVVGTPDYMAPEQALGLPADFRSDIYALGTILFEMLVGSTPFEDQDAEAVMQAKRTVDPTVRGRFRPDVPAAMEAIVARALARERDHRYQTAQELRSALEACVPARPSREDNASTEVVWPLRQRRIGVLGASLAVTAGVAAVGVYLLTRVSAQRTEPRAKPEQQRPPEVAAAAAEVDPPVQVDAGRPMARAPGRGTPHVPVAKLPAVAGRGPLHGGRVLSPAPSPVAPTTAPQAPEPRRQGIAALLERAREALKARRYVEAIDLGEEALAGRGEDLDAHLTVATANLMLGRVEEAKRHFQAAAKLDPGNKQAAEGLAAIRRVE